MLGWLNPTQPRMDCPQICHNDIWFFLFLSLFFFLAASFVGISVPGLGIEPRPRQWKPRIITTWPPGDSPYWLFWIKVDWEEASTRRKLRFFSVPLKAENKPHSIWRYKDILINKDSEFGGRKFIQTNRVILIYHFKPQVCLHSSLTFGAHTKSLRFFVLLILHKFVSLSKK